MAEPRLRWLQEAGPGSWALLGATVWAALALVAALAGMGGRIAPAELPASDPLPVAGKPAPERIGPYAQYREAELRPLFATDRRPRAFEIAGRAGPATPVEAQPLNLRLTGVLISPRVQLATVQVPGGEAERVRLGQSPDAASGWRLVSLAPRSAVFEGPGGRQTLELQVSGVAAAPAKPATPVPPPPPPPPVPAQDDAEAADAAAAAQEAAAQAEAAAMSTSQREQVDAIRARIEARRAQMRNTAPPPVATPPKPTP